MEARQRGSHHETQVILVQMFGILDPALFLSSRGTAGCLEITRSLCW